MNVKIGQRIKTCRQSAGMSQEELCKKCGYKNRSVISRIEKGEIDLSQSKLKAIAAALDVPVSAIMDYDGQIAYYEEIFSDARRQQAVELYDRFCMLNVPNQNAVRLMIESLISVQQTPINVLTQKDAADTVSR